MRNTRRGRRTLATTVALLTVGALALGGCASDASSESEDTSDSANTVTIEGFTPYKEDTLTVAVWGLPSTGDFDGLDTDDPGDGFGSQIVHQMAEDFGLSNVEVVVRNFAATTSGNVTDFDIAYAPSPTEERQQVAEFSDCFWSQASVVMTSKDLDLETVEDLKELQWGVTLGSVQASIITDEVQPYSEPNQFNGVTELYPALLNGTVDAVVGSVADVVPYLNNEEYADFDVHVRLVPSDDIQSVTCSAMLLPEGSTNVDLVNQALAAMESSGQLEEWYEEYYVPNYDGLDPEALPTIDVG
ncbi:MAG: transporter substrate-binding domain-containing protein [Microbacterium sp.]